MIFEVTSLYFSEISEQTEELVADVVNRPKIYLHEL